MHVKRRIGELDSLRGIAALCVLLFHYTSKYAEIFMTDLTTKGFDFKLGHYGVQLFFIISGFVIFMSIENVKSLFEFLYKRFIRLYPIFWLCVTITFIITSLFPPGFGRTYYDYFLSLTMVPSILGAKPIDGVYWSLAPELFFYLLITFVIVFKLKNQINFIGYIWLLIILADYLYNLPSIITVALNLRWGILFLIGINFYQIFCDQKNLIKSSFQIFVAVVLGFLINEMIFQYFLIFFIFVFYLFVYSKLKFLANNFLMFFGKISYCLYLVHQFIGFTIQYNLIKFGISNFWILIFFPTVISILLAYLLTQFVEKRILSSSKNYYNVLYSKLVRLEKDIK